MESAERDIELVLVTGAGASHDLGAGKPLPLMGDWSNSLVKKLASGASGYVQATGLAADLAPMEFEERLGKFLRDVAAFSQVQDLVAVSKQFLHGPTYNALTAQGVLEGWHSSTMHQLDEIVELIRVSLYEEFGEPRFDLQRAKDSYERLLQVLGVGASTHWVYATTNYDTIGETAIEELGYLPDWGEPRRARQGEQPIKVERLLEGLSRYVPVLHLHGRIGWYYRTEGSERGAPYATTATTHQAGFGVPIVMLPDPQKAYDSDPVINSLWEQFAQALRRAKRVFVLGHSLNDETLVRALRENVASPGLIAVSVLAHDRPARRDAGELVLSTTPEFEPGSLEEKIQTQLGGNAAIVPLRFGEPLDSRALETIADWTAREREKGNL